MKISKVLPTALFLMVMTPVAAQAQSSTAVNLYVFAGQSNMRGHVSNLTSLAYGPSLLPAPYKAAFAAPVTWAQEWNCGHQRPATTDTSDGAFGTAFMPYLAAADSATQQAFPWGPEVAFIYNRHASAPTTPIYLVKYAIGGTALYAAPGIANWNAQTTGTDSLLAALISRVQAATSWLKQHGAASVAVHLLWDQGESDQGSHGQTYLTNFKALSSAMQTQLANGTTTFDVESMTLVANSASHYAEANITLGASAVGAQVVNVHGYPTNYFISDNLHLTPTGQIQQGTDMELLTRTKPRVVINQTATSIMTLNLTIPQGTNPIAYIPTTADGSTGLAMTATATGKTTGLTLDPLYGTLRSPNPSLLVPGQQKLVLHRYTAASEVQTTLILNFTQ